MNKKKLIINILIIVVLIFAIGIPKLVNWVKKEHEKSIKEWGQISSEYYSSLPEDIAELHKFYIELQNFRGRVFTLRGHGLNSPLFIKETLFPVGIIFEEDLVLVVKYSHLDLNDKEFGKTDLTLEIWNKNFCSGYKFLGHDVFFFKKLWNGIWDIQNHKYNKIPTDLQQKISFLKTQMKS